MFRTIETIGAVVFLAAGMTVATFAAALSPAPIEGVWLTKTKSEITVAPCGDGWCGYISKIVVPDDIKAKYGDDLAAIGENYTDAMNPDPTLRDRPILGLKILTLKASSKTNIYDGEIYNPEEGKTYSGFLEFVSESKVVLNGCVMMGLICRGEDWERVK